MTKQNKITKPLTEIKLKTFIKMKINQKNYDSISLLLK